MLRLSPFPSLSSLFQLILLPFFKMDLESKLIQEPCEARIRHTNINWLRKCDFSAKEAKYLGVTRIDTSIFFAKVLYEIQFPPELKGQTRYLKGPRVFEPRVFPEFLVTVDKYKDYRGCALDTKAQLIIAVRVDDVETGQFTDPTGHLSSFKYILSKFGDYNDFRRVIMFWSYHIYDWKRDLYGRHAVLDCRQFGHCLSKGPDCSRPTNNIRIQAYIKHILGAELDWAEFLWHYHGVTATSKGSIQFACWKGFAYMEAQHDVAEAMAAGAEEALADRRHYACRALLHQILGEKKKNYHILIEGLYPHPGWYIYGSRIPFERKWAGKRPDPPARPRGEPVISGIRVYDKLELENKRDTE
ncbi:hypothetical protein D6D22_10248 [Aureobasidium pullulans]|uniref:Uncharacterized protein n=1 Tax=Aureobasidium pullulans TaxID=5580 RepID=A0A4S8WXB8_AURPU|nr:hypothetical protein D6D22_10248 [Aureobasidium pullulans]